MNDIPLHAGQPVRLNDTFYFYADALNVYPLLEWRTRISHGYQLPSGRTGAQRWDEARFHAEPLPGPVYLVWDHVSSELFENKDDDSVLQFMLNDEPLSPMDELPGFSENQLIFNLSDSLWTGENLLKIMSASSTRQPVVVQEWLSLRGDFFVRTLEGLQVLSPPPLTLKTGSWTEQGYPYYQGTGVYRQTVDIPGAGENAHYQLVFEAFADTAEIYNNGTFVGVLQPGDRQITMSGFVEPGANRFEIRITNTWKEEPQMIMKPSGLLGPVFLEVR
jgi:hypothetical protein